MSSNVIIKKTTNTYEAAFYTMQGGILSNVYVNKLPEISDKAESSQWVMEMSGVNPVWVDWWDFNRAFGNIRSFSVFRKELKKNIRKILRDKKLI